MSVAPPSTTTARQNNNSSNNNKRYVLAFGDSLTEGFYNWGMKFHPYSNKLKDLLDMEGFYGIDQFGISGETTRSMVSRLKELFDSSQYKYSFVIILGGTNDLGEKKPDKIVANLKSLYTQCIDHGALPIAVTIPEMSQELQLKWLTPCRNTVNEQLKAFCTEKNIPVVDLATKIPYASLSDSDRKKYWDDGIHFTPAGYDKFATIIHEVLKTKL